MGSMEVVRVILPPRFKSRSRIYFFKSSGDTGCCCFLFSLAQIDEPTPILSTLVTTARANDVGTWKPKNSKIILVPIKPKTIATAGSRYCRSVAALDSIVYRLRKPMIAKRFEEKTTSGFCVCDEGIGLKRKR